MILELLAKEGSSDSLIGLNEETEKNSLSNKQKDVYTGPQLIETTVFNGGTSIKYWM